MVSIVTGFYTVEITLSKFKLDLIRLQFVFSQSVVYLLAISSVSQHNTEKEQLSEAVTLEEPSTSSNAPESLPQSAVPAEEEEVDIDLGDPEVQKAAVFIQSGFKGFKQRKISQGLTQVDSFLFCLMKNL